MSPSLLVALQLDSCCQNQWQGWMRRLEMITIIEWEVNEWTVAVSQYQVVRQVRTCVLGSSDLVSSDGRTQFGHSAVGTAADLMTSPSKTNHKTKYDIKYNPASFHFQNMNMYKYLYCSVAYISVACPTYKKNAFWDTWPSQVHTSHLPMHPR